MLDRIDSGRCAIGIGCAAALMAGCQSYEPVPLDLAAHRTSYAARGEALGSGADFADRLAAMGVMPPERFDVRDGVSLPEAEAIALLFNPELRLARRRAGVTLAEHEHAGLWQDPEFGFSGTELLSPTGPFQFEFMLNLTLPVSGRLAVERARAGAAHEAELRRIVDAEWSVRCAVRRGWAAWTIAEERAALLRSAADAMQRLGATSAELESLGELSRVDGRMVRLELLERRIAHRQAELEADRARRELFALMGVPVDADWSLLPGLPDDGSGGMSASPGNAALHDRLIAGNTALAVRRAEYQIAEESLRLEVRKQYPDITIGGGYGSEDNDDRLLLGVSLPIPVLNANRGGIAVARAERDLARANAEAEFERIASRFGEHYAEWRALREQRVLHESQVLPLVDEQVAELDRLAGFGEWSTLVLIDAVSRQIDAKTRLLDLRLDELRTAIFIDELFGPNHAADHTIEINNDMTDKDGTKQ